jgi:hypothetical protein
MSGSFLRVLVVFRSALLVLALSVAGSVDLTPALAQLLEVVDANGTKVGLYVLSVQEQTPIVAFHAPDGRVFTLQVTQNSFLADFDYLLFASPDCTGTPFLFDNGLFLPSGAVDPTLFPPVAVVPPGHTVHLPGPGSLSQEVAVGSILYADGTCEAFEPSTALVFPAQAIGDLNTQFTPPFRVQLGTLPPASAPTFR